MASPPKDAPNATTPPPAKEATGAPQASPRYRIGAVLGKGGMGVVRIARDQRLNRDVALKTNLQGDSPDQVLQLAREAWLTAHLRHPGIIPVFDAGANGDTFYYTMALVEGRTLSDVLKSTSSLEERLALLRHLLDACEAVAYAHSRGVVHCDLKPHNIMVGAFGETQVVDWGLAVIPDPQQEQAWRALGLPQMDRRSTALPTGTPAYMSPEQARSERLDARTDVWSLGAILFQILTGVPPHHKGNWAQLHLRAREGRVPSIAHLQPDAPPELIAIAQRAMSRRPLRYADASALAAELGRWFEGRRIVAYQYTATDHLRRLTRAWRVPLRIGGAVLLATSTIAVWSILQTSSGVHRAREAEASAQAARSLAGEHLSKALTYRAVVAARNGARPQAELLAAHALELAPQPDAKGVLASFPTDARPTKVGHIELPASCRKQWLSWSGDTLWCLTDDAVGRWSLATHPPAPQWRHRAKDPLALYPHPDKGMVGVAEAQRGILWLNAVDGTVMHRGSTNAATFQEQPSPTGLAAGGAQGKLLIPGGSAITFVPSHEAPYRAIESAAVSPDGRTLARLDRGGHVLLSSMDDILAGIVDDDLRIMPEPEATEYTDLTDLFADDHAARALAWLPDSAHLVVGSIRGRIGVWSPEQGLVTWAELPVGKIRRLVPSPDGRMVLVQGTRGDPQLWDLVTGTSAGRIPVGPVESARWSGTDELSFLTSDGVEVWRVPTHTSPATFRHPVGLSNLSLSADGSLVAIARSDARVDIRDTRTGELLHVIHGAVPGQVCKSSAFTADGTQVITSCLDGGLRVTDLATGQSERRIASGDYRRVGIMSNGRFWGQQYDAPVETFTGEDDQAQLQTGPPTEQVVANADGSALAMLDNTGQIHVLRPDNPHSLERWRTVSGAQAVAIDAQARTVAVSRSDEVLLLTDQWEPPRSLPVATEVDAMALSPDGGRLALGFPDGSLQLHDTHTGHLLLRSSLHTERISSLVFHPSGQELWSASWDGSVRRLSLRQPDVDAQELVEQLEEAWDLELRDILASTPI